jgi:hypothetical protein
LFGIDISGDGPSATPAWVSSVNNYCQTVADPELRKSGILAAATAAEYVQAEPEAEKTSSEISDRMYRYALSNSVQGSAQLALLSISTDWGNVAKYEQAAAKAYSAGNGASFIRAVQVANGWAMEGRRIASLLGLHDCAEVG